VVEKRMGSYVDHTIQRPRIGRKPRTHQTLPPRRLVRSFACIALRWRYALMGLVYLEATPATATKQPNHAAIRGLGRKRELTPDSRCGARDPGQQINAPVDPHQGNANPCAPWAMVGNARRQSWRMRHSWQRGISNLQISNTACGYESHPHRHLESTDYIDTSGVWV
jgi:hypothetical protein